MLCSKSCKSNSSIIFNATIDFSVLCEEVYQIECTKLTSFSPLFLIQQRTLSRYFNPCYATAQLKPTFISKVRVVTNSAVLGVVCSLEGGG